MKQCPTCRTTYTDDSLKYCLADGGTLIDVGTEAETFVRPGLRVDIPSPTSPTVHSTAGPSPSKSSPVLKIVAAFLVVGFLGLLVLGGAGALFYFNSGGTRVAVASPTPTPRPSPTRSTSPTPELDEERLEQELANLQKQLEDALKPEPSQAPPGSESDGRPTARVNSPGDGFLALRSEPDAHEGERLAEIPHGAVVSLENCEKEKVKIGSRTGRWCMVTYRDQTGWVFDAWLDY